MLTRLFEKWAAKRQSKEISAFLDILATMHSDEIGLVVAAATDFRHRVFEQHGIDLRYPSTVLALSPWFTFELSSSAVRMQRDGRPQDAARLMVWVHTLRAMNRPSLREKGRILWQELSRGFPYVDQAADNYHLVTGEFLDTTDAEVIPDGLEDRW